MVKYILIYFLGFAFYNMQEASAIEKQPWEEAEEAYKAGEQAQTIAERTEAFNQALSLYSTLETEHQPNYGNGKLYYNIADTYYQLEEYPRAVYYYYRSQALRPRDDEVRKNLDSALAQLSLKPVSNSMGFQDILTLHDFLSLPERLQILFLLGVVLLVLLSLSIWWGYQKLKTLLYITAIFWAVMLINVGYSHYFSPIEGVVINSSLLYINAGEQYAKVSEQPIAAGNKVQVLDVEKDGQWVKVLSTKGEVGYLSASAIRLL